MDDFKKSLKVDIKEKPVERLTEREARRMYERFVMDQEDQFLLFINYLNKFINRLREQGKISQFLKFYARIKATNSALKNYEKKALDDIFGIEFICAAEGEIKLLKEQLDKLVKVEREKAHNKDNGYKAIHDSCIMKPEIIERLNGIAGEGNEKKSEEFPMIEIQYKTIEVFYQAAFGTASHEKYKGVQLPQLQALYDTDSLTVGEYLPYMWMSDPDNDEMRELTTEEVLKKMYPSLELKKEEKLSKHQEKNGDER